METSTILQILDSAACGGFQLHEEYAEPGYENPDSQLIATGNWNSQGGHNGKPVDNTMPRIAAILEKLGAELEWEDEWCSCEGCRKLFRTSPSSYSWKCSYWDSNGCGLYCHECVKEGPKGYLEHLEGNAGAANTLDLDLGEHEYREVDAEFENGLHGGQDDDPKVIAESLRKLGVKRFIFEIDSVGQFDLSFSVWVHKSEYDKLDPDEIDSKGAGPAIAMQVALRGN